MQLVEMSPFLQMQVALCILEIQEAFLGQILSNWHGSTQYPIKQVSVSMQSLFELQSSGFFGIPGSVCYINDE